MSRPELIDNLINYIVLLRLNSVKKTIFMMLRLPFPILSSSLLLILLLCATGSLAQADQCGDWQQACVPISYTDIFNETHIIASLEITGVSVGSLWLQRHIYSGSACDTIAVSTELSGTWADLGPSNVISVSWY